MTLTTERRHALAPATIQTLIRRATDQEIADAIPADELDQAEILDLVAAVRTARIAVSWPGDDVTCHDQPAPLDVDGLMQLVHDFGDHCAASVHVEAATGVGDSRGRRAAQDTLDQIRATLASITPAAPSPATPSAEDRGRGLAAALRLVDLLDLTGLDLHDVEQAAIGSARRLAEWISTGNETAWQPPEIGATLTVPDGTGQETASPATVGAEQPPGAHQDTPDPWRLDLDAIETRADAACPGPWEICNANEGTTSMPSWEIVNDAYLNPSSDDDEPWIAVHVETGRREDAEFIAHARQDVPALIAEVRALRAAVDQRTQALRNLADAAEQLTFELYDDCDGRRSRRTLAALSAATTTLEAQQ